MTNNDAQYNDPAFCTHLLITVCDDDPSKIFEASDDAKYMVEAGAAMGSTRAQMMAEYIVYAFTKSNPHLTVVIKTIEANDDAINDALAAHIESKGW